jgi:hypothetical protein
MWQSIAKQITDCMDTPFCIDKRQLLLHTQDSNYYQISDQKLGISPSEFRKNPTGYSMFEGDKVKKL